jgi:hypothetical protein
MDFIKSAIILTVVCLAASAQPIPLEMRDGQISEYQFRPADLAKAETRKAVAKMGLTAEPDDARMVGVVVAKSRPSSSSTDFATVSVLKPAKGAEDRAIRFAAYGVRFRGITAGAV